MPDFKDIHRSTASVYERNAAGWDRERSRSLYEKCWLDRLIEPMPQSAAILDVGCGAGEPIAEYLIERGLSVTGVDASEPMIAMCRRRFSDHRWLVADMRALDLEGPFDGIIGWDSFFHLNPEEQRALLRVFGRLLGPAGRLLLTVGPEAGEVLGSVEGEPVYHSSLAPAEYEQILGDAGMREVEMTFEDASCGGRTVLLAAK